MAKEQQKPGYRFFDHTGDFGADLEGRDPLELTAMLARAYLDLLTGAPETVEEREALEVEVRGLDLPDLLVALGNELVFLFETEKLLVARFEPTALEEGRLAGIAHGERFDPARHPIARPVKAVTHHQAAVEKLGRRWRARIIFDL